MSDELEPRRDALRASDHDRNRVVTMLSDALGQGQITFPEYEERSRHAVEARTFADLDRLVVDLPAVSVNPPAPALPAYQPPAIPPEGLPRLGDHKLAIMSGTNVRGPIAVGAEHSASAFWGGVKLDLREATFLARDVTINAYAVMGGVEIIVPRGAIVQVDGLAIMGAFENKVQHVGDGSGPRIRVTGFAFWGGVEVKTK
ncbi:putative protein OS=Tsukamurella paurometabola (strain ATCC 8368 / DSM / CCUG 35730 /CIP 100753 / JCM 10117 / KCTC 9821 / NBRC 16120 / NCIMB 702349/ NCTC 13040) OX=521096 GN=Tpau_3297 PE=4 SV=1 [Tsukamurella paurometabola]|uniref:DUF1707 domain-containing protein n=1 Tax=Tsukamurella paurometabola (strain ATCC 8368 / DSM 20162 / CCUG 35730 / CIP 100753 / JCM 10117 / KCTC 9821 / NBRC 16120 / NCIMB 702349 / NCTC 13040) TaxID=521096 RepID=D5UVV0_TSUPD|nr:DUF1707 domain-containing protein [Tsukamurella paurometabola]ADG79882.1 protein of unknown function DUF1707 [Tsukamurella paurometabola DSM 20162]SUP37518.1 Domain of uncharacterised function (DUF1707) [Tsukamurella paurometabola]